MTKRSIIWVALLIPLQAEASSFYLESSVFPAYDQSATSSKGSNTLQTIGGNFSGNAQNPKSGFSYDLRSTAGFKFWDRLLVGFTYNYAKKPQKADAATDNDSLNALTKKSEYGPAIGYVGSNVRLIFTYFVGGSESYSETSADLSGALQSDFSITNHLRNGYQFILGYSFNLTPNMQIGPSLVYRHVAYKTQDAANNLNPSDANQNYTGRAFTSDVVESNLTPMISLSLQLF